MCRATAATTTSIRARCESTPLKMNIICGSFSVICVQHLQVNYRANIYALKSLGVAWIISVSAVGSLQEHIVPGHVVLADQYIDRTTKRVNTFFQVSHRALARGMIEAGRHCCARAVRRPDLLHAARILEGGTSNTTIYTAIQYHLMMLSPLLNCGRCATSRSTRTTTAACMSTWRGQPSPRAPSPTCTASGAHRSSA